ncbi:MAG: phosphoglycerate mutase family protein [Saprospiraceae bacterium]
MKTLSLSGIFLIGLACIISVTSCKQAPPAVPVYDGKTISDIKSNVIHLADGSEIVLEEDSIAKIFYLVRHAEKDTSIKVEPPLTEEGLVRATKLADILRGTRIDAIYSTMTLRTMFTVDSLADIKAMAILPYDNKELKKLLVEIQQNDHQNRIFIVGHSNTIPSLTNTLAGRDVFTNIFDESDYGNFIIVVEKKSGAKDAYSLRY